MTVQRPPSRAERLRSERCERDAAAAIAAAEAVVAAPRALTPALQADRRAFVRGKAELAVEDLLEAIRTEDGERLARLVWCADRHLAEAVVELLEGAIW